LYFVLHQPVALEKRAPFAPKTHKNDRFCPRYARADPGPRSRIDDDRFAGRSPLRQAKRRDVPRKPGRTQRKDLTPGGADHRVNVFRGEMSVAARLAA